MPDATKYAIGQQSFEQLRKGGALYVDKTVHISRLVNSSSKYYFLARPRRFGKSLLLSTLKCLFEGKRNLFEGLYITTTDWNWVKHPVLHLDLNPETYVTGEALDDVIDAMLTRWEDEYGVTVKSDNQSVRFQRVIEQAHLCTGHEVVILVDEYDKPLVNNMNQYEQFQPFRDKLSALYANFKNCADHIRLVFLTGVSRFSKLSVFSGLNNLNDITFSNDYADICGITGQELTQYFHDGIERLASRYGMTHDDMTGSLKANYDGYRFAEDGSEIYNPWSILNAMNEVRIDNYWNDTGMPTLLAEALKKMDIDLEPFFNSECGIDELKGLDLDNPQPLALLYQTGYLTIKDFNLQRNRYRLGIPNNEVKEGLMDVMLPYYSDLRNTNANAYVWKFIDLLEKGDAESFMKELQSFFARIPYEMGMENELNFHNALYIFLTLLGIKVGTEVHTSDGRIDLLITACKYLYIIELKYDGTPHEALCQINEKRYDLPYANENYDIIKIGASFSSITRRIDNWIIET